MSRKRAPKLTVSAGEGVRYIEVPTDEALAIKEYLRGKGIHVSPPVPCSAGVDTIQLTSGITTDVIQHHLDQRYKRAAGVRKVPVRAKS